MLCPVSYAICGRVIDVENTQREAQQALEQAVDASALQAWRVQFLGKSGRVTALMQSLKQLPVAERPAFGQQVNRLKQQLEKSFERQAQSLQARRWDEQMQKESCDLSLPGPERSLGQKHLVTQVMDEIVGILLRLGYSVAEGPLIESRWYNFEALNIPAHHPSVDMHDTFYVDDTHVLRTHTSPVQVRVLEQHTPPLRILSPGEVFRCDADASHAPSFHQIEGFLVDRKVSFAHLKGTINFFVQEFFGKNIKTRFRPSYFPFTEPSAEMDCQCPTCRGKGCSLCKQAGWIEIGGSGLVHPRVFELAKLDSSWQGFAFGFGIERMAMVKYGVRDIRWFTHNWVD